MRFRAVRVKSGPFWAVVVLLLAVDAGAARSSTLRATYAGFLGDAHLIDVRVSLALPSQPQRTGPYAGEYAVDLVPGLGRMLAFNMTGSVSGTQDAVGPRPDRYASLARLSGREERIVLDYGVGNRVDIFSEPPSRESEEAKAKQIGRGTLDPVSAGLALIHAVQASGRCAGRARVFDGVRRYDLDLAQVGPASVTRYGFSIYEGPATECSVRPTLLSGFRPQALQAGVYPQEARVWLAAAHPDAPLVVVRVGARNNLGLMRLELVGLEAVE